MNKILIAEDEEINFLFIKEILEEENIEFVRAHNGQEAVDILKNDNTFTLVFMDLKMPILNGYDATKLIRKFNPNIPIIAITAYAFRNDQEDALEAGCTDYLSKPFTLDLFFDKIESYLITPG